MSFTPSKEDLIEAKKYIAKTCDDYGTMLRVKMLMEQSEKLLKIKDLVNDENLTKSEAVNKISEIFNT